MSHSRFRRFGSANLVKISFFAELRYTENFYRRFHNLQGDSRLRSTIGIPLWLIICRPLRGSTKLSATRGYTNRETHHEPLANMELRKNLSNLTQQKRNLTRLLSRTPKSTIRYVSEIWINNDLTFTDYPAV